MLDFIVIGGGIAGLSAAAELSGLGSVLVLEAEDTFGYHASGRSAAMFLEGYGNDTVRALNAASTETLHASDVLSRRGFMLLARAGEDALLEQTAAGFGAAPIPLADAQALFPILNPDVVARAAYLPDAFDLDTDRLLQHYLRTARTNGARFETRALVSALTRTANGWTVSAGPRSYDAGVVINAAGAWADQVAGLAGLASLGIQPYRRSMARLPAPGGRDTRDWPFVDEVSEAWYAKPDAGGWIVSPAEEDPVDPHDAWAEDIVIAEGLARYQPYVTEEVTRVETTWAGLRSFAPDRTLVLGPDPVEPAFLWCAGQGGYGFQTAPAAARLIAAWAGGVQPELPEPIVAALSPARFAG